MSATHTSSPNTEKGNASGPFRDPPLCAPHSPTAPDEDEDEYGTQPRLTSTEFSSHEGSFYASLCLESRRPPPLIPSSSRTQQAKIFAVPAEMETPNSPAGISRSSVQADGGEERREKAGPATSPRASSTLDHQSQHARSPVTTLEDLMAWRRACREDRSPRTQSSLGSSSTANSPTTHTSATNSRPNTIVAAANTAPTISGAAGPPRQAAPAALQAHCPFSPCLYSSPQSTQSPPVRHRYPEAAAQEGGPSLHCCEHNGSGSQANNSSNSGSVSSVTRGFCSGLLCVPSTTSWKLTKPTNSSPRAVTEENLDDRYTKDARNIDHTFRPLYFLQTLLKELFSIFTDAHEDVKSRLYAALAFFLFFFVIGYIIFA